MLLDLNEDLFLLITHFLNTANLLDLALVNKRFYNFFYSPQRVNVWRLDKHLLDSNLRDVTILTSVQKLQFTHLTLKVMYDSEFEDDLEYFVNLTKPFVHHLELRTTKGLKIGSGFAKLHSLKIHAVSGCCEIDASVCEKLKRLEYSYLDNLAINALKSTRNLQYLSITVREIVDDCTLSIEDLEEVLKNNTSTLTDLTIKICDTNIQQPLFEAISTYCSKLERLTIALTRPDLITKFPRINTLKSLSLDMTVQSARCFMQASFPELESLELNLIQRDAEEQNVTSPIVSADAFPKLRSLKLSSSVDPSFILCKMPDTIQELKLLLSEECIAIYRFSRLKRFSADFSIDVVRFLKSNTEIESLSVIVPMQDDYSEMFDVLSQRKTLQSLELDGLIVSENTFDRLAEALPDLYSLHVHHVANPVKELVEINMTKTANWIMFKFEPFHDYIMTSSILLNLPRLRILNLTINHTGTINNILCALHQTENNLEELTLYFYFGFAAIQKFNIEILGYLVPKIAKTNIKVTLPCWPVGAVDSLITLCLCLGRYTQVTFNDDYRFDYLALNHRSGVRHEDREFYQKQFVELCQQNGCIIFGGAPYSGMVSALISKLLKSSVDHVNGLRLQEKRKLLDTSISDLHAKKFVFNRLAQHYLWRLAPPPAPVLPAIRRSISQEIKSNHRKRSCRIS